MHGNKKMMNKSTIFLLVICLMQISCDHSKQKSARHTVGLKSGSEKGLPLQGAGSLPYDFRVPSAKFSLPGVLAEVSGISWYRRDVLACVQDEKGSLYLYNLAAGKIVSSYKFSGGGDFEDVVAVVDTIYALRSDGVIFKIDGISGRDVAIEKITTALSPRNDAEGLTYDRQTNELLIACKGDPNLEQRKEATGMKAVYGFSLQEKKLNTHPRFLIDVKRLSEAEEKNWVRKQSIQLGKALKLFGDDLDFQPSGIAIHPITDEIYILSHVGKRLVVLDRSGRVVAVELLGRDLFRQPEGICFSPEGDLFISNEGDGSKANILKFQYLPR